MRCPWGLMKRKVKVITVVRDLLLPTVGDVPFE
jgi:hypothetical protein